MRHIGPAAALLALLWAAGDARGQTTTNPDISVIPRFLISSTDNGARVLSQPDLSFQELELALQAYLNPFARGDVILTVPGPDIATAHLGIEELYVSVVRGLPGELNLRLGKYRAEFGKLNTMHPHAWPFISQPLVAARFLGEEGLNDLGLSASVLLPTGDLYTKLTVDLLRGSAIGGVTGRPDSTGGRPFYANTARLMAFFPLGDDTDTELGLSTYTGIHDPVARDRFWYINGDMKVKYRPSAYTSLVVQGEYLLNTRRVSGALARSLRGAEAPEAITVTSSGLTLWLEYQFQKIFTVGGRYDRSASPYSADDRARGVALFFGYYPVEETLGLRFEYNTVREETPLDARTVNTLALQVLFSLGPHKAHPF